jgi:very-short-patch-repair endonuclease
MCKICKIEFKNKNSLAKHLRIHNLSLIDYYIKYEELEIPKCKCGKPCKLRKGIEFTKTCCDYKCKSDQSKRKHSEESKKIISEKRIEWLKNNPDKHPWKKNTKFISVPCEILKNIFIENGLNFETELQPMTDRFYSIDIAFIDKGIGIEVNGNQHYNSDKELKDYYKKRKELIEDKGWKLYDIHYTKIYDNDFISNLIKLIKGTDINIDLDFSFNEIIESKCLCGNKIYKYNKSGKCLSCSNISNRKVERPDIEILKIDIKNLGYTGTGRKYGVSDNAIRKWIKMAP